MRALLALLLIACSAKPSEEPGPACTTCVSAGVSACAEGFESDGDGGCSPLLRECAEGELATPGACQPVGVEACAPGFTRADGGCVATLSKECTGGTRATPGEPKCVALGCVEPIAGAIYVDPAYVGESDGSPARPFKELAGALAVVSASRKTVFLAEGKHAFAGTIDKPVEIVGRCTATTSVVSTGTGAPVTIAADVTLRGISVSGGDVGVVVNSGSATLTDMWIHSTQQTGVLARAKVTLTSSVVENNKGVGLALEGATATVEGSELRHNVTAIRARAASSLSVRRSVISDQQAEGIFAAKSTVVVDESVIRRSGIRITAEANGIYGSASTVTLTKSVIDATAGMALGVFDGTLTMDNSVVSGTTGSRSGGGVPILIASDPGTRKPAHATIRRSLIHGNEDAGLLVGGTVTITGSIVRASARGIVVSKQKGTTIVPELTARDVLIERSIRTGVTVEAGAVSLERVVVRDVQPEEEMFGIGLYVFTDDATMPARVTATGMLIEDTADAGVAVFGAHLDLSRSVVRRVRERVPGIYGHGVHFTPFGELTATGSVRSSVISDVSEVGLLIFRSSIAVEDTTIANVGANGAAGELGDGISVTGVTVKDETWGDANASVRSCKITKVARSAVSVFNARASLSGLLARCNALDVSVETAIEGHPSALEDLGNNACGCASLAACRASAANIKPIGSAL